MKEKETKREERRSGKEEGHPQAHKLLRSLVCRWQVFHFGIPFCLLASEGGE